MERTQVENLLLEMICMLGLHQPEQIPARFFLSVSEMFALLELSAAVRFSSEPGRTMMRQEIPASGG
jgi:hypothetical protein